MVHISPTEVPSRKKKVWLHLKHTLKLQDGFVVMPCQRENKALQEASGGGEWIEFQSSISFG